MISRQKATKDLIAILNGMGLPVAEIARKSGVSHCTAYAATQRFSSLFEYLPDPAKRKDSLHYTHIPRRVGYTPR